MSGNSPSLLLDLKPFPLRVYQEEALWGKFPMIPRPNQPRLRRWALIWSRRRGKSFTLAVRSLVRMIRLRHDVYVISASRDTGEENIRKLIEVWKAVMNAARALLKEGGGLSMIDGKTKKSVDSLDMDALEELFESSRLQVQVKHDHTTYSRAKLLAANANTAVGYGGDIYIDEATRILDLARLIEAAGPIMQDQPDYELGYTTTPSIDDQHVSFELLRPEQNDFTPSPRGNYYRSPGGILVHRVDALDAEAAGLPFLDEETGLPVSVWDALARAFDQQAFMRNYLCRFLAGGSAAVSTEALNAACLGGANLGVANYYTGELAV